MDPTAATITLYGLLIVSILVSVIGLTYIATVAHDVARIAREVSTNLKESQNWTQAYGAALLLKDIEAEKLLNQILTKVSQGVNR